MGQVRSHCDMRNVEIEKEEAIVLDAQLTAVLHMRAFRAQLVNGHEVVAYRRVIERGALELGPGDRVRLRLSPFDMSVGEILDKETEFSGHESKIVSS